jgi:hypothetical protein
MWCRQPGEVAVLSAAAPPTVTIGAGDVGLADHVSAARHTPGI